MSYYPLQSYTGRKTSPGKIVLGGGVGGKIRWSWDLDQGGGHGREEQETFVEGVQLQG